MEPDEIDQWCAFCEGRDDFDRHHFSTLFMELYLQPLTDKDTRDLETIFQYFPTSSVMVEKMLRIGRRADDRSEGEILALVAQDLREKRAIVAAETGNAAVLAAIDGGQYLLTQDEARLRAARESSVYSQFYYALATYFMRELARREQKYSALSEAFYKIASEPPLDWSLTASLLGLEPSFDHYFELYLLGVDYAIEEEAVVVMNYRAAMSADPGL